MGKTRQEAPELLPSERHGAVSRRSHSLALVPETKHVRNSNIAEIPTYIRQAGRIGCVIGECVRTVTRLTLIAAYDGRMTAPYNALALAPVALDEPAPSTVRRPRHLMADNATEQGNLAALRRMIAQLDRNFERLALDPGENSPCPAEIAEIAENLRAFQGLARHAELSLLGRIVTRQVAFTERLMAAKSPWGLLAKLALEELVTVLDMVLDVVELVGSDSGCRHEERFSFRILASVAPQILAEVDGMTFREIRFHQVSSRAQGALAR
jgi:hypothetical protein